jgi:hypothetical protein
MSVHAPQKATVEMVRSTKPEPRFQTADAQEWLTLSAPDHTSAQESRRATPEEIDQVFIEQLAARPQSTFLCEVVADRARRQLRGEDL